jgi:hypothetical protein
MLPEIKQRKKCGNCRAYKSGNCTFGYKVKTIFFGGIGGIPIDGKPLEPCPKPLTYESYIYAIKFKR